MKANKKIILAAILIAVLSALTVAYAVYSQQQVVHISGSTTYPTNSPSPSPSSSPSSSVQFSLWFPNGTVFPTSISNPPMNVIAGNPNPQPNPPQATPSYTLTFVARNDGSVPVNITIGGANANLPVAVAMGFAFDPSTSPSGDSAVIGVGQSQTLIINFYMTTSTTVQYTPGATFSYSFDLTFTGTQAN